MIKIKQLILLILLISTSEVFSQQPNDCSNATIICGNINFTYRPTGPGNDDFATNPNPPCLPTGNVESQSVWLEITIANSGSLEFVIKPNNGTDDYDWAIYGPNANCNSLVNPVRCSSTQFLGDGSTGLGNGTTDTSEGPGTGDGFLAPLTVVSGQRFIIFINNWSSTSSGFDLEFGGTATFNDPPTIDTPTGTALDIEQCDTDGIDDGISEFDLTVNSPIIIGAQTGVDVKYYTTDGDAQVDNNAITTPANYNNISSPQTIYARITSRTSGCFETTEFDIVVLGSLNIGTPNNLFICDDNNDGFAQFDLTQNDVDVQKGEINTVVTYHPTENDADLAINNLPSLYTNSVAYSQETIWARLENTITGCFSIASFTIEVFDTPIFNPIPDQLICDDDNDGFWSFDFLALNSIVLGSQSSVDFSITYHMSQNDSDTNSNPIASPYINQITYQNETIYARIENNLNIDCYETGSFIINVFNSPTAIATNYELCDNLNDGDDTNGIVEFDLFLKQAEVYGAQPTTEFEVKFYYSQAAADAAVVGTEITTPIQNTSNPQTIYARIENRGNINCYETTSFDLIVNPLPVVSPIVILTQCDDNADGYTPFNLTEANGLISNDATNEVFTYYLTQVEADNGLPADQIPNFINYTNPTALNSSVYARVETVNGCYRTARIDLVVGATQIPQAFNLSYFVCDDKLVDNDNANGIAPFDFSNATVQIEALFPVGQNLTITYYTNEVDALAETNPILDISNHRNETSAFIQQIYVRVDNDNINACLGLGQHITLNVDPVPNNNAITNYELCSDNDQAIFDLTTKDFEVIGTQLTPILITYHLTEQDAINNIPIINANNYTNITNSQTIYVRAQFDDNANGVDDAGECYSNTDMSFQLIVKHNPDIFLPDDIRICSDQIVTDYDLTVRENQITGGDNSITLSYYESQLDLDNNNPIVNPTAYTNTLLNRDILVLATGINLCTSTTTLSLRTILYDNINQNPTPIEECETDNNGFDYFDITRRELEILNGLNALDFSFTYYELEADAIIGNTNNITNLGNFENTVAVTQVIYVRVQPVANECFIVVPLTLIVNPVPEIGIYDKYVICLDNTDSVINPTLITFFPNPPIDTQLNPLEYTFQWYNGTESEVNSNPNSVIINGEIGPIYIPTTIGFYTVIATNIATGCRIPATTEVVGSYPPEQITVALVSETFSENNVIEVEVVGNGEYEFRLDFGPWQNEPRFENVTGGEHTIYVRDLLNCNEISQIQIVIDYPRYFTPNNDGYHDTWNIKGMSSQQNSTVHIFDRYGKLLKQLSPLGYGWDGTFNGKKSPSNDYWFVVEFIEPSDGITKQFRAHFTLKR